MRQLTDDELAKEPKTFSKLPMRQLTMYAKLSRYDRFSKLPMRQLTDLDIGMGNVAFSKLPMRQLTMPEQKKNPTARALIHLFPTLTQIYSCFKIY